MVGHKIKNILFGIVYYIIAVMLLFAGISKILEPQPMLDSIKLIINMNEELQIAAATLLPVVEIVLGIMLLFKKNIKESITVITILFGFFFLISIYGNVVGLDNDCGCFGKVIENKFGTGMIIRNAFMLLISFSLRIYINEYLVNAGK